MQRSNSDFLNKYTLPSGVATNSQELRSLQKKLLQNSYQPQQRSIHPSSPSYQQLQKSRQLQTYDSQKALSQKQLKETLSSDLQQQIRIKNQISQLSRNQNTTQQLTLTKHLNKIDQLQRQKQKSFNKKYKEEALEDLKLKYNNKMKQVNFNQAQKEFYRNRYSVGDLTQSYKEKNSTYSNPTQQYYREVDRAMHNREQKILNPQHLKNSSFKITRRADHLNKLNFMFEGQQHHSSYQQQNNIFKEMKQRENNEKNALKSILLQQIKEKETNRKNQKMAQFYQPYHSRDYNFRHHPINNPVDYRLAHDNKYVMKELGTIQ